MMALKIDISEIVALAQKQLIETEPHVVQYKDANDLVNGVLPTALSGKSMNLYALWSRLRPDQRWTLMYIGEQNVYAGQTRIRQHLFLKKTSTQTKQENIREVLSAGGQIGITAILIEPDTMRLAIEEELIIRNIKTENCLPWNLRGKGLARAWQKAETRRRSSSSN